MAFKFENLIVWQKAVDLSPDISELANTFSKDELYILTAQLKRTSDSISLNIAEDRPDKQQRNLKSFCYAIQSAMEVVTCFFLARKRKLIDATVFDNYYEKLTELIKGLQALRKSLK
jgi:four helix bundle protein